MRILVTGIAGFIGFHLARRLTLSGHQVIGIDNLNNYYDVGLKIDRLRQLGVMTDPSRSPNILEIDVAHSNLFDIKFYQCGLEDNKAINKIFAQESIDAVCNLAAQAGVRFSLTNPDKYIDANVTGFLNILEACKNHTVKNLSYASSSSVYGLNSNLPFKESDSADHPISMYAASKKMNELMAHTYSHLYNIKTTGLRFFTVYGPWGRPDMALFKFTKAAIEGEEIHLYNSGDMIRDFTYVDDIVQGIEQVILHPAESNASWQSDKPTPNSSAAPYKIYNIGNNNPVNLKDFINEIQKKVGKEIKFKSMGMQPGDVPKTHASSAELSEAFQYAPSTSIAFGVSQFVEWYIDYYKIN